MKNLTNLEIVESPSTFPKSNIHEFSERNLRKEEMGPPGFRIVKHPFRLRCQSVLQVPLKQDGVNQILIHTGPLTAELPQILFESIAVDLSSKNTAQPRPPVTDHYAILRIQD